MRGAVGRQREVWMHRAAVAAPHADLGAKAQTVVLADPQPDGRPPRDLSGALVLPGDDDAPIARGDLGETGAGRVAQRLWRRPAAVCAAGQVLHPRGLRVVHFRDQVEDAGIDGGVGKAGELAGRAQRVFGAIVPARIRRRQEIAGRLHRCRRHEDRRGRRAQL